MKKIYLTPVLLITLLAAGGCGAQTDEAESENVSLVLSNLFSSIDQEDSYSFTGTLTLEKEGQESQSLSIEGSAQVDQDAKVSYISISNINEISQAIQ